MSSDKTLNAPNDKRASKNRSNCSRQNPPMSPSSSSLTASFSPPDPSSTVYVTPEESSRCAASSISSVMRKLTPKPKDDNDSDKKEKTAITPNFENQQQRSSKRAKDDPSDDGDDKKKASVPIHQLKRKQRHNEVNNPKPPPTASLRSKKPPPASAAASGPPPLVWVLEGKTHHSAFLLERGAKTSHVQWNTTQDKSWVPTKNVFDNLPSSRGQRRRKRPCVEQQEEDSKKHKKKDATTVSETSATTTKTTVDKPSSSKSTSTRPSRRNDYHHRPKRTASKSVLPNPPQPKVLFARKSPTLPTSTGDDVDEKNRASREDSEKAAATVRCDDKGSKNIRAEKSDWATKRAVASSVAAITAPLRRETSAAHRSAAPLPKAPPNRNVTKQASPKPAAVSSFHTKARNDNHKGRLSHTTTMIDLTSDNDDDDDEVVFLHSISALRSPARNTAAKQTKERRNQEPQGRRANNKAPLSSKRIIDLT